MSAVDKRGNCHDRRSRREWILRTFGNGEQAPCVYCMKALDYKSLTVDRIVPGESYRRENIQPACFRCNNRKGDYSLWKPTIWPLNLQAQALA